VTTTLTQSVVDGLKDRILTGELGPGAKLPSEKELLDEYDVSRTVVREAVSRLQAEGLVETFQGRGSFVLAVPEPSSFRLEQRAIRSQADVLAMIDFRLGIECEAAALAAGRVRGRAARAVEQAMADFAAAGPDTVVEADFRFHRAVSAATGNRFYVELLDSLGPMMIMLPRVRLGARYSLTDQAHVDRVLREHDAIATAVLSHDAETARAAMRLHLGSTRRRVTEED
jgi:GntR family transcriptional regulator, transcriptional repressor for pyruvate dehydrogenase complex